MTLPAFDSLDAVPEPFRPFAKADDTGKVSLDLVPGAELVGLRQKAAQLLEEKKRLAAQFEGVDVEEYKNLKATKGKTVDLDARLQAAAAKEAELTGELTKLRQSMRTSAKKQEVTRALAAENANIALLEPLVSQMVDVDEVDGQMHVVIRSADGGIRYKDGAGNRFTVADLLAEMKTKPEYQPAFMTKVGSGGNASPSSGGGGSQGIRLIDPNDKRAVMAAIQSGEIRSGKAKIAAA